MVGTDTQWAEREQKLRVEMDKDQHWANRRDIGIPELRPKQHPDMYELNPPVKMRKLKKSEISPDSPAIMDPEWQKFRKSIKGTTTEEKFGHLKVWYEKSGRTELAEIQIINYVNALKRGGQVK